MDFVFTSPRIPEPAKPPDDTTKGKATMKPSFRDMLTEGQVIAPVKEKEDLIAKGLMNIELEGGNRLLPKVTFDEKLLSELCGPWQQALVVKLLGKTVGYNLMKERLTKLWKLQGGFEIMDVDNGFFMVKCDHGGDREKIISQGPWMLFDHYLAVTQWTREFTSPTAKVEKTLVWIRFRGLNLVYYDESVLLGIAAAVGKPVRVDTNTLKVERGRFARICVEIDLTKPVVGKVCINGYWHKVQYEGLHIICGACGCYGHFTRDCAATKTVEKRPEGLVVSPAAAIDSVGKQAENLSTTPRNVEVSTGLEKDAEIHGIEDVNNLHGEWLIVSRKKRGTNVGKKQNWKGNDGNPHQVGPRNKSQVVINGKKGNSNNNNTTLWHRVPKSGPINGGSNLKRRRQDSSLFIEKQIHSNLAPTQAVVCANNGPLYGQTSVVNGRVIKPTQGRKQTDLVNKQDIQRRSTEANYDLTNKYTIGNVNVGVDDMNESPLWHTDSSPLGDDAEVVLETPNSWEDHAMAKT